MKDILEKNLKTISDYENQPQELRYSTPIPQSVEEAYIAIRPALYEVTWHDSAALKNILSKFEGGLPFARLASYPGTTIFHVAARYNRDSLEILIDQYKSRVLEALDINAHTLINNAARYNSDSLELLIDEFGGAVLAAPLAHNGSAALHLAATFNRDAFKLLIDKIPQAAISLFTEKDCDGDTALHVAIQNGNGDLLQPLIEKHPEITQSFLSARNIKGNTPLHFAAEYDKDFFTFLIEKFGDKILEVKNDNDHTVLYVAAERNKDSLELLIEKFSDIIESLLSMQDDKSRTILHIAALYNKGSLELLVEIFPEIMKSLLPKQTAAGHTPLHLATGNEGAFKLLIEKFPEQVKNLLYVENEFGDTVLQYALSDCPDALPKEYQTPQKSCIILGNENSMPIPGIPEAFSSYYQDQVVLLLKLRLKDAAPEALKSVNVLEANYTLRENNEDNIAEKLSSFILASHKNTILMPLNIGGSHLVGIAAVKDGNNVVIHYMDSEQGPPPQSLFTNIESMLESHSHSMELKICEVERQKYSNCGPEVIENLTAFVSKEPRASQEEAILKHSLAFERHLLKDSDDIHYADTGIPFASTAFFSSPYAILDEKLLAQLQHYLRTGEAFDTARSAIEDGTLHITRQPFVLDEAELANTERMLRPAQAYNEESYNDSLDALHHPIAELSPGINILAIAGLLSGFLLNQTPELVI